MKEIHMASYGAGTNSTALIIGLTKAGIKLDVILFADTGGERPETYAFIQRFNKWLVANGQPEIITVKRVNFEGNIMTLEQNCLSHGMLPSIAYGFKKCSHKFKIQPQEKYMNNYPPAKELWKAGGKVIKYIGFDANESRRIKPDYDNKYEKRYPLIEWNWNRERCVQAILEAGLCLPGKSACFFCPNSKKEEILGLPKDLQQRAINIEHAAKDKLIELKGLGRRYSWEALIAAHQTKEEDFEELELYGMPCECID